MISVQPYIWRHAVSRHAVSVAIVVINRKDKSLLKIIVYDSLVWLVPSSSRPDLPQSVVKNEEKIVDWYDDDREKTTLHLFFNR